MTSRLRSLLWAGMCCGVSFAQWPGFRGPNGSGVGDGTGYPAELKKAVWKAAIPYAQSSPVVIDNHVYLTASTKADLLTICLDARTGRELWRKAINRDKPVNTFRANDPASPTPAADAAGVVVFFAEFGLIAYSPEGAERWRVPLGPFKNFYGMAASPLIAADLVVMLCDQQFNSYLLAVDRKTGARRWKTDRPGMPIGFSTPAVHQPPNGPAELIVLGSIRLDTYYLATGERHWSMPIRTGGSLGTPLSNGDTIFVSSMATDEPYLPTFAAALEKYDKDKDGRLSYDEFHSDPDFGEHFGWIDANDDKFIDEKEWNAARDLGDGDYGAIALTANGTVKWRVKKSLPYIPAPLLYQNVFYMVRTGGIVTALDPATGKVLKAGRAPQAPGDYLASPVAADGKVYLSSEEGKITVLKAGPQWEVLSVNEIGSELHATPALAGGRVYIRAHDAVYCFGAVR